MAYYVYELVDPRDQTVFYVGKGKGNRINQHEVEARTGRLSRKCDVIRAIEESGLGITKRKVRSFADEQEAYDLEAELIEFYGLDRLTNVIPGGGTARLGPTVYGDRIMVRAAAEIINRTMNGTIRAILVAGKPFDLVPIIEDYKRRAFAIAERRGFEWANAISERLGVKFSSV